MVMMMMEGKGLKFMANLHRFLGHMHNPKTTFRPDFRPNLGSILLAGAHPFEAVFNLCLSSTLSFSLVNLKCKEMEKES